MRQFVIAALCINTNRHRLRLYFLPVQKVISAIIFFSAFIMLHITTKSHTAESTNCVNKIVKAPLHCALLSLHHMKAVSTTKNCGVTLESPQNREQQVLQASIHTPMLFVLHSVQFTSLLQNISPATFYLRFWDCTPQPVTLARLGKKQAHTLISHRARSGISRALFSCTPQTALEPKLCALLQLHCV